MRGTPWPGRDTPEQILGKLRPIDVAVAIAKTKVDDASEEDLPLCDGPAASVAYES